MRVRAENDRRSAVDATLPDQTRRLRVDATSTASLRASLSGPLGAVRSRRFTIVVTSWQAPRSGWSARLGPLPGLLRHDLRLPTGGPGVVRLAVVLAEPLPFQLVAGAALGALSFPARQPVPVSPDVAAYGRLPAWLPPWDNVAGVVGASPDETIIRPYDVLVGERGDAPGSVVNPVLDPALDPTGPVVAPASAWELAGKVAIDATLINPRGYQASDDLDATVEIVGGRATVRADGVDFTDPLASLKAFAAVRALRSVRVDVLDGTDPAATAALFAQLAMTGVAVHVAGPLPGPVAGLLSAPLAQILAEPLPPATGPVTRWEARSVRQRRAALRGHATGWALPAVAGFPAPLRTPSVTAILVLTEPAAVGTALTMFAGSTYPALELVVVRDPSFVDVDGMLAGLGHPVQVVDLPAGAELADTSPDRLDQACALAASRARGSLITLIEPGALYGPEHIWDLVLARHYSGGAVVGKACEFYRDGPDAVVRPTAAASECFTDSLSDGPVLLSRTDLIAAGGWRRVATGPGYRTHPFGFVRPLPPAIQREQPADHDPAGSRSAMDNRAFPLTVVTS